MENTNDYQINYWAGKETYEYKSPKLKRSLKRKLAIVFGFILVLAITPTLIYALTNLNLTPRREVSVVVPQKTPAPVNSTPEVHEVIIEEPKNQEKVAEVINNDSYWKISKRVCGDGKYYLSIQSQNGGKALFLGDTVIANCTL